MLNLFNYIDIYPSRILLSYKGLRGFHTSIGSFLSICTYILFLLAFINMGQDMMYRNNPTVITQTIKQEQRPFQYIGINNYTFSFVFTNDTNHIVVPPSYFTFEAGYTTLNSTGAFYQSIPTTKCNISFYKGFEKEYHGDYPEYYLTTCFDLKTFILGGYWTEAIMSSINIKVKVCQNQTNSQIQCASLEEIKSLVQKQLYLNVYFSDKIIDVSNYENPIKSMIKTLFWTLDLYTYKYCNIIFKPIEIETDNGFMMENKNTIKDALVVQEQIESASNQNMKNSYIFILDIYSADEILQYKRKYKKLQDVISQIGGVLNVIIITCKILVQIYSKYQFTYIFVNDIFDIEQQQEKQEQQTKNKQTTQNIQNNQTINTNREQELKYQTKEVKDQKGLNQG